MQTVIFQAAKLGDKAFLLDEILHAKDLLEHGNRFDSVYGISGGSLPALAFSLAYSARTEPAKWGAAASALEDFYTFLRAAKSSQLRKLNSNPWYGLYNLQPLKNWLINQIKHYTQAFRPPSAGLPDFEDLAIKLYLCAIDRDGTFNLFGTIDPDLTFQYHAIQVGPPKKAGVVEACIASLSTMISTEPLQIGNEWYRDCRPAIPNAVAIVSDLQKREPQLIIHKLPYAPIRKWKRNWITSSFIMHSQNERNQVLLAEYYLDLQQKKLELIQLLAELEKRPGIIKKTTRGPGDSPVLRHIDLPYIGSTEALTNMRQSVINKKALMEEFNRLLSGQLDGFPFHQDANVIYGAGGFSGILAGLVTTRKVDAGFKNQGGRIRQIYGASAGVLNGFFHAVQVAAQRHPQNFTSKALTALADLEDFISHLTPKQITRINLNPFRFWQGWANLDPLRNFLIEKLREYTGSNNPQQLTFDDINLPLTVVVARLDGFNDFLGMTTPERSCLFAGKQLKVTSAPIVSSILAGWSMNTYIEPTCLNNESYTDGAGTFYDPALFVACFDQNLTNLLNIHLDEPDGHSYHLPPRPNLLQILLDTHNYVFPEERRRMRSLSDLLYSCEQDRNQIIAAINNLPEHIRYNFEPPADFRTQWSVRSLDDSLPGLT